MLFVVREILVLVSTFFCRRLCLTSHYLDLLVQVSVEHIIPPWFRRIFEREFSRLGC